MPEVEVKGLEEPTSELELFSQEVLNALVQDSIPPSPKNFQLYFDRLLEKKSVDFQQEVSKIIDFESDNSDDKQAEFEKHLKHGFSSIKQVLQLTANVYKNLNLMNKILEKKQVEIEAITKDQELKKFVFGLKKDVNSLNEIMIKQVTTMKELYQETAQTIKAVEQETIFDNKFGVYNKRHLLFKLEQEQRLISQYKHHSSLLMITVSRKLMNALKSEKQRLMMLRTVARLILKTSRRSDIISHYGDGVFGVMLSHTDTNSAEHASERLWDLVAGSNFFIGQKEIKIDIKIGIVEVEESQDKERIVVDALDAMESANEENVKYKVAE